MDKSSQLTFFEAFVVVLKSWRLVAFCVAISTALAVFYLHFAKESYTVSVTVSPVASSSSQPSRGLSAVASFAGVSLGGDSGQQQFELFLMGLHHNESASILLNNQALIREIYAAEWDADEEVWRKPVNLKRTLLSIVKQFLGLATPVWRPPDKDRLARFLTESIAITRSRDGNTAILEIETEQPELGKRVLAEIIRVSDAVLRERSLQRSNSYIDYLTGRLKEVSVADYRGALISAITEQEKARMMVHSDLNYAAEPFGEPAVSVFPSNPKGKLLLMISIILGFGIGVIISLYHYLYKAV